MERLTARIDNGLDEIYFINPDDPEGAYNLDDIVRHGSYETKLAIAERLADYEDSGLYPEEVHELAKAKTDGRLVELPYKVDALKEMYTKLIKPTGDDAETYTTGYRNGHRNGQIELLMYILQIPPDAREEAEKALEGMK